MNEDISRNVIQVCKDIGLEVRSYSGRCMYGRSCVGVECGRNVHQTLAKIVIGLCELSDVGVEDADHLTREGAIASDSLGLGSILYFPRLPWLDDEENEDEPLSSQPDSVSETP